MDNHTGYHDQFGIEEVEVGLSNGSANARQDHYEYDSLNVEMLDSFRLLLLNPGNRDDPLQGTLLIAAQSDRLEYAALSYVWGYTKHQGVILVDNISLSISANLSTLLKNLRHRGDTLSPVD